MNPLSLQSSFKTLPEENLIEEQMSIDDIRVKIGSIEALQTDLIGVEIGERILKNLGPIGKARVAQKVFNKSNKPKTDQMDIMMRLTILSANSAIEDGKTKFLSDEDAGNFILSVIYPIEDVIKNSFSRPDWFLEHGAHFQISDYEPVGVLRKTAEKLNIQVTSNDCPIKYLIYLKLDRQLTNEKSELIFSLTEKSQGVEFSKTTFSLKELEEKFQSSLRQL